MNEPVTNGRAWDMLRENRSDNNYGGTRIKGKSPVLDRVLAQLRQDPANARLSAVQLGKKAGASRETASLAKKIWASTARLEQPTAPVSTPSPSLDFSAFADLCELGDELQKTRRQLINAVRTLLTRLGLSPQDLIMEEE
jgi:hypothetical protein